MDFTINNVPAGWKRPRPVHDVLSENRVLRRLSVSNVR